jgi:hypothetical protein
MELLRFVEVANFKIWVKLGWVKLGGEDGPSLLSLTELFVFFINTLRA